VHESLFVWFGGKLHLVTISEVRSSLSKSLRGLFTGLVVSHIPPSVGRSILLEESTMFTTNGVDNVMSNLGLVATLGLEVETLVLLNKVAILDVSSVVVGFSSSPAQNVRVLHLGNDLGRIWGRWSGFGWIIKEDVNVIYLVVILENIVAINGYDARRTVMKASPRWEWDAV
jgi:hypothetical protein